LAEPLPQQKEVKSLVPFETLESSLDKDAQLFTEEEDDLEETIELPKEQELTHTPIELKPVPTSLCYVFLNGDKQTPALLVISLPNGRLPNS
jgi:hypothetical protein